MFLTILILILSIVGSGLVYFFTKLYSVWYFFWITILLIPAFYIAIFALLLLVLFIITRFINTKKPLKKRSKVAFWLVMEVDFMLCWISGARIHFENKNMMPKERCVIIYNHISNFDPMVIMAQYPHNQVYCITKPQNFNIPICGGFIYKAGFIAINREDNRKALDAIKKAVNYINNDIGSICIAPEGTRSKDLKLHEFHPGSFKIATMTKAPIVAIAIKNTNMIHKNFPFKPTKVTMKICDVLNYEDYKNLNTIEISERIHDKIGEELK